MFNRVQNMPLEKLTKIKPKKFEDSQKRCFTPVLNPLESISKGRTLWFSERTSEKTSWFSVYYCTSLLKRVSTQVRTSRPEVI